jgi:hypothetical protein
MSSHLYMKIYYEYIIYQKILLHKMLFKNVFSMFLKNIQQNI